MPIPNRAHERTVTRLNELIPLVAQTTPRDVSEVETSAIEKDPSSEIFDDVTSPDVRSEDRPTDPEMAESDDDTPVDLRVMTTLVPEPS